MASKFVSTTNIADGSITTQKLAENSIGPTNIVPSTSDQVYINPHQHQHTIAPNPFQQPGHTFQWPSVQVPQDPWAVIQPIDGLDELCEMLGVEEGGQVPLLTGRTGKRYSLVNVLRAQMEMMVRLNILLVHRNLVPEAE